MGCPYLSGDTAMAMSCLTISRSFSSLSRLCAATPEEIQDVVRETVIHEVGHYFGLDDARLEELME